MSHRTLVLGSRLLPDSGGIDRQRIVDRLALALEVSCYAASFLLLAQAIVVRGLALVF